MRAPRQKDKSRKRCGQQILGTDVGRKVDLRESKRFIYCLHSAIPMCWSSLSATLYWRRQRQRYDFNLIPLIVFIAPSYPQHEHCLWRVSHAHTFRSDDGDDCTRNFLTYTHIQMCRVAWNGVSVASMATANGQHKQQKCATVGVGISYINIRTYLC